MISFNTPFLRTFLNLFIEFHCYFHIYIVGANLLLLSLHGSIPFRISPCLGHFLEIVVLLWLCNWLSFRLTHNGHRKRPWAKISLNNLRKFAAVLLYYTGVVYKYQWCIIGCIKILKIQKTGMFCFYITCICILYSKLHKATKTTTSALNAKY